MICIFIFNLIPVFVYAVDDYDNIMDFEGLAITPKNRGYTTINMLSIDGIKWKITGGKISNNYPIDNKGVVLAGNKFNNSCISFTTKKGISHISIDLKIAGKYYDAIREIGLYIDGILVNKTITPYKSSEERKKFVQLSYDVEKDGKVMVEIKPVNPPDKEAPVTVDNIVWSDYVEKAEVPQEDEKDTANHQETPKTPEEKEKNENQNTENQNEKVNEKPDEEKPPKNSNEKKEEDVHSDTKNTQNNDNKSKEHQENLEVSDNEEDETKGKDKGKDEEQEQNVQTDKTTQNKSKNQGDVKPDDKPHIDVISPNTNPILKNNPQKRPKNTLYNSHISTPAKQENVDNIPICEIFDDVNPTDWFAPPVEYTYYKNLISGTSDKFFSPYAYVNNDEFLKIVYLFGGSLDVKIPAYSNKPKYIQYSCQCGLITDYAQEHIEEYLSENITRYQVLFFLYKYSVHLGIDAYNDEKIHTKVFTDIGEISDDEKNVIDFAINNDLIYGYEDGTLRLNKYITRGELAAIVARYDNLILNFM